MILSIAWLLISSLKFEWPDPYIGYGAGLFPTSFYSGTTGAMIRQKQHKPYLSLGFPMQIGTIDDSILTTRFNPELSFGSTIFQSNFMFGIEAASPGIYRDVLSAYIWGAEAGIHIGTLLSPESPIDKNGHGISFSDQLSVASIFSFYVGPQFYIGRNLDLRILINPRILAGHIAERTFAMDSHPWMGWQLNVNLQFQMAGWAKETYSNLRK